MRIPTIALVCCCCCTHALITEIFEAGVGHDHEKPGKLEFYKEEAKGDNEHEILDKFQIQRFRYREQAKAAATAKVRAVRSRLSRSIDVDGNEGPQLKDETPEIDETWTTAKQWGYATLAYTCIGLD